MFYDAQHHPQIVQLIEQAHLAILRQDHDHTVILLNQILQMDSANQDAHRMLAEISKTERQVRTEADDSRIKQEQDEAWRRNQAYQNEQLKQEAKDGCFWAVFRGIIDSLPWR